MGASTHDSPSAARSRLWVVPRTGAATPGRIMRERAAKGFHHRRRAIDRIVAQDETLREPPGQAQERPTYGHSALAQPLPRPRTSLVGRSGQTAAVRRLLLD